MSTSALPRGKTLEVLVKDQASFAAAATGNYTKTYIYSSTIMERKPFENDPLLGLPRTNNRDATAPAPALPSHNGNLKVPFCLNHFGLWLKSYFGAPTTTGSTNFTHVFASGGEVVPYKTIELKLGSDYFQHIGQLGSKFALELSKKSGYREASLDLVGRSEAKLVSSAGGTPASPMALDQVPGTLGTFKINDVAVADVLSVNIEYDNKPTPQDYVGSEYVSGYDFDEEATYTGQIKLRFRTTALYELAAAGTAFAGDILFEKSANNSIKFACPNMRLEKMGHEITGPGGIEQTFAFRGEQSSSAAMLTITLKNQIASY